MMTERLFVIILIFWAAINCLTIAGEPFNDFDQKVTKILCTRFPHAELKTPKDSPETHVFTHNMRDFVIYRLNKSGEWQAPMTVQGPDRGGIAVKFRIIRGEWEGALEVPYIGTDDLNVFKENYVVKNSGNGKWYIWAEILTPKVDTSEEVKNDLIKLFNDFDKYME
jgi:hypothetical protein